MKDSNLSYAVLALVAAREEGAHGYRLCADFNALYAESFSVAYGQLYRILADLETAGNLSLEEQAQSRRPTRRVYRITEKGLRTLREWMASPLAICPQPLSDEVSAKLLLVDPGDVETIAAIIRQYRHVCLDRLAFTARKQRVLRNTRVDERIARLIVDGLETRVRAELAWLEHIERTVVKEWPVAP
jgi:DNA-binding PadR family transcriptional regulator